MERLNRQKRCLIRCVVCDALFTTHYYRALTAKYCSKACWAARATTFQCATCGVTVKTDSRRKKYCSRECYAAQIRGDQHHCWKGGASLDAERARVSSKLATWRRAVFRRDAFTCQHCGSSGQYLHAHHVEPFATRPDLRFDVANGITLCVPCHGKVHDRDFSNRRVKTCTGCGARIAGRTSTLCRTCAARKAVQAGKKPPRRTTGPSPPGQPSFL